MASTDCKIQLGLAAGNVYQNRSNEIRQLFEDRGWFFLSPGDIKERLTNLAGIGYENDPVTIAAKLLVR